MRASAASADPRALWHRGFSAVSVDPDTALYEYGHVRFATPKGHDRRHPHRDVSVGWESIVGHASAG
jgi:hypothetical protein